MSTSRPLLFSVDVEEFYPAAPNRDPCGGPLPALIFRYLDLLQRYNMRVTFFIVGDVARRYPEALRAIAADGHELACHGDRHLTLDQFTPEAFAEDLRLNRAAVEAVTGTQVVGFRAPLLSLTETTSWAYEILASEGFTYSSSVLPAPNPLFGWPSFGRAPSLHAGVLEIPITLASPLGAGALPVFSGTYFRVLPWPLVRRQIRRLAPELPLACYFHPYDIDHRQPWAMHAGVRGSRLMNSLLFVRRRSLLGRIARLLTSVPTATSYRDYVTQRLV